MKGYAGEILLIDLTERKTTRLATHDYESWVGGHGLGSALFWELVADKGIDGFDPANAVTMMTSPLSGTLVPGASARVEVQGIGVHSSPIGWFTRSNFGGRFSQMLKAAGWDGVVVTGRAENPVFVDIRNDRVTIEDARHLWGLDTWQTQERIWHHVMGAGDFLRWTHSEAGPKTGRTTQRPAVVAIGPAGENLSRISCLIHDAGNASGQGGFGAVWGAKKLKAISVIGTGSVDIADPNELMEARLWAQRQYSRDFENPRNSQFARFGPAKPQVIYWKRQKQGRMQACVGCHLGCRERTGTGLANETNCITTLAYSRFGKRQRDGKSNNAMYIAADLMQKYGINSTEIRRGLEYLAALHKQGLVGPGKQIDCELDFETLGETGFIERFLKMIALRQGIGDDIAEGFYRAAKRWGRLEEDQKSGLLYYTYWGLPEHGYDPRTQVEWGYGSILGDRDANEHSFSTLYVWPTFYGRRGKSALPPAEQLVTLISSKLAPFENNPAMLDYSDANIYSGHMAKLVAWHRRYSRFWIQSALFCDFRWPDFYNSRREDGLGLTGIGEPRFFKAVTGKEITFAQGVEIGRKIWNLDNAIWSLQGRHRDMVHFPEYIYTVPFKRSVYKMPGRVDGKWDYIRVDGRHLDRAKFEAWKSTYYQLEGWSTKTGWPRRATLESLGLSKVAAELEKKRPAA